MPGPGAIGAIQPLQGLGQIQKALEAHAPHQAKDASFAHALGRLVETTNAQQLAADRAVVGLATGQVANIHEAIVAAEKARVSLEILAEMRNKLVAAYQEIMRMQI
jgi:flagellar hook-basal body complex protein FliE